MAPAPCYLVGSWLIDFDVSGSQYMHGMFVTTQQGDGDLAGYGGYPAGSPEDYTHKWTMTGLIDAEGSIETTIVYHTGNPGYEVYMTGDVVDCGTMSGTMTTSAIQSGTWTATRVGP